MLGFCVGWMCLPNVLCIIVLEPSANDRINLIYFIWFRLCIDPRVDQYPLTSSPMVIILLTAAYIYFVTNSGQRFMKSRKPFEIDGIIQVYNLFQIVINLFIGVFVSIFRLTSSPSDFISVMNGIARVLNRVELATQQPNH